MDWDTIIVGSGLSGLSCALLLARSGRRVLVLEQRPQPAPLIRGFSRDGLYFDSGFHYVGGAGEGGAFRPLLQHLGLLEELEFFPYAQQGFDRLYTGDTGEAEPLPVGFAAIRTTLTRRFPAVAAEIERYLKEVEQGWAAFPYLNPELDFADFNLAAVHGPSLAERLQLFADYPQLQGLLSMHSFLYGVPAAQASTRLNAQVAGSYYHSVHGLVGGGKALADAYLRLLARAGGQVRCSAAVTEVLLEQKRVRGVRLESGECLTAKEVLLTSNPSLLPELLPAGALRPAASQRLRNLRQTASAYILYGRAPERLPELDGCNRFVQRQAGIFSIDPGLPLDQRSYYLTAAGDPQQRGIIAIFPAGFAELAPFAGNGRRRGEGYREQKRSVADRLLERLADDFPELAGLELLELATPLTLQDYSAAPQGAIYGVGHYLGQYNPLPVTKLTGLYLSGQAVAAPGWLGAVVAAYLTCGMILGPQQLQEEVRRCR